MFQSLLLGLAMVTGDCDCEKQFLPPALIGIATLGQGHVASDDYARFPLYALGGYTFVETEHMTFGLDNSSCAFVRISGPSTYVSCFGEEATCEAMVVVNHGPVVGQRAYFLETPCDPGDLIQLVGSLTFFKTSSIVDVVPWPLMH